MAKNPMKGGGGGDRAGGREGGGGGDREIRFRRMGIGKLIKMEEKEE